MAACRPHSPRRDATVGFRSLSLFPRRVLPVVADHFLDHEADELLAELGIEVGIDRQRNWRTAKLHSPAQECKPIVGESVAFFLHDGRARNLTEAILWHGGEAEAARDAFASLNKDDRTALLAFLESL